VVLRLHEFAAVRLCLDHDNASPAARKRHPCDRVPVRRPGWVDLSVHPGLDGPELAELATLAGVAMVTERARLATTILQLPPRNEVLVAKQAAVIDQLSGGRLVLGVAQGGREDDFQVLEAEFEGRSERFECQIERIREVWLKARESDREQGVVGPPPIQEPAPPIWVGAFQSKAIQRAARVGDGFIFDTVGAGYMKQLTPQGRELFAAEGKPNIEVAGLAYVAVDDNAQEALEVGTHHVLRY
jgi:alkanesulfonate monooxygenase SsuD/methylene tetrahydromethanopterin reductase-like flavin-dependent oxidoreductase (luciferase family)